MIYVRVPATSANLGPGFDCFGLALTLYGHLGFEEIESGLEFENVEEKYCNEDNLAVKAYFRALSEMSLPRRGLRVAIYSDIPPCSGLGSSASLLAAGLVAANAAHGNPLDSAVLLRLATEMEGHPDNVAPALLGGMTASIMDGSNVLSLNCPLSQKLRFMVLVPDFELSTQKARAALPKQVALTDATFNVSRAAVLLRALEKGDMAAIGVAMNDRLHQPYRANLIDEYDDVRRLALQSGAAAFCISGAGPTLMCVYEENREFEEKMAQGLRKMKNHWRALALKPDMVGAVVEGEERP